MSVGRLWSCTQSCSLVKRVGVGGKPSSVERFPRFPALGPSSHSTPASCYQALRELATPCPVLPFTIDTLLPSITTCPAPLILLVKTTSAARLDAMRAIYDGQSHTSRVPAGWRGGRGIFSGGHEGWRLTPGEQASPFRRELLPNRGCRQDSPDPRVACLDLTGGVDRFESLQERDIKASGEGERGSDRAVLFLTASLSLLLDT